jgi:uncharacterized protein involved in exopolysaccharide biosynthesis
VTVVAEQAQDSARDEFYGHWAVFRENDIPTEAELMTSKPVLARVVKELELTYDDVYHPFLRYAGYLWSESWVGKRYRRVKEWLFPPAESPYSPTEEEIEFARTLDDFSTGVGVQAAADANVGDLIVRGPSPRVAEIANKMIDVYLDERVERQMNEARRASEALGVEVAKATAELKEIEDRREEYYDDNSLLLEFEKDKVEISRWLELEASIVEEEASIASMERTIEELKANFAQEPETMVASRVMAENELLKSMRAHRFTLMTSLADALLRYKPDSDEVRELQELIAGVDAMIEQETDQVQQSETTVKSETFESTRQQIQALESTLAGTRAKHAVKQAAANALRERIDSIPEKMRMAHDLGRMQSVLEKKQMLLQEKQMMADVFVTAVRSTPPSIQVVSYATAPAKPVWPNKKLLLAIGGLLGLGMGVGLAVLLETIRGRVSTDRLSQTGASPGLYATIDMHGRRGWSGRERARAASTTRAPDR